MMPVFRVIEQEVVSMDRGVNSSCWVVLFQTEYGPEWRMAPFDPYPTREEAEHDIPAMRGALQEDFYEQTGMCRVCGCTDKKACPVLPRCHWVEPGLCSSCGSEFPRINAFGIEVP